MSKEDIISTYQVCIRRPDSYCGVYMYTHNLEEALDIFSDACKHRAYGKNPDADQWLINEEMFIVKQQEEVAKYLNSNCDNISKSEAEYLAKLHGFPLEDVWYWLK